MTSTPNKSKTAALMSGFVVSNKSRNQAILSITYPPLLSNSNLDPCNVHFPFVRMQIFIMLCWISLQYYATLIRHCYVQTIKCILLNLMVIS